MAELPEGAFRLEEDETLRRQVHPSRIGDDGHPMRLAYQPNSGDGGLLSTLRERVAPEDAYRRYVEEQKHESVGTWGINVSSVEEAGLVCFDDSATVCADHASVDFREKSTTGALKQATRKIRDASVEGGRLHPSADE